MYILFHYFCYITIKRLNSKYVKENINFTTMKTNLLFIFLILILLNSCNSLSKFNNTYSNYTIDELKNKSKELEVYLNHIIALQYLELLETRNLIPALGNFGWKEVDKYWDSIPELKKYREDFEAANEALLAFIRNNDASWDKNVDLYKSKIITKEEFDSKKREIFKNLSTKYPTQYKVFRKNRDKKLGISNRKTLELIILDYHSNNKLFPIDWIPQNSLVEIKKTKDVRRINRELSYIKKKLVASNNFNL